ncbi:glycosyltransferase [Pseudanabaena minima]|uniref:glycosyltransferase n=1 Tax=Pseudanabaena minima TaxID=890415 RepID=UPI003DA9FD5B
MKIGFYGGMANNMYVFAKAFVDMGYDVCFIRDRTDKYPFSQPSWEDVSANLSYSQVAIAAQWTSEQWTDWEVQQSWQSPHWIVDPDHRGTSIGQPQIKCWLHKILFRHLLKYQPRWQKILFLMQTCDVLLVCGIEGEILAMLSGKPFAMWIHGGDIRTAAGLHPPHAPNFRQWIYYQSQLELLRQSFRQTVFAGMQDPTGGGGHIGDAFKGLRTSRFGHLPIPLKANPRLSYQSRRQTLNELMSRLGLPIPQAEFIGFIPSRLDFYWKGHDRLLEALNRLSKIEREKIHIIASGWGKNYEDIRESIKHNNLENQFTLLPYVVSKPILYKFFASADFVIDQFLMGSYGSSAIEAMSFSTPVMMYINSKNFEKQGWEPPPVLNANNVNEIYQILRKITTYQISLDELASSTYLWLKRNHSQEVVINQLADKLQLKVFHDETKN